MNTKQTRCRKAYYQKNSHVWRDVYAPAKREQRAAWAQRNADRMKFYRHRYSAKKRGMGTELTFDQWMTLWDGQLHRSGQKADDLQVCRYEDSGPYSLENCYIATAAENRSGPRMRN